MKKHISHLQIALKSVVFNWRMEVSVLLGTVLAAAVLVGALLVGDSVTYSLRRFALLRLGETRTILQADGRFFDAGLAAKLEREAGVPFAPALLLRGVVLMDHPNGDPTQVNHVQVIGVDPRFWTFAPGADIALTDERIAVNSKLATQLGAAPGAELSVRIGKPSLMPRDAPLSSRTEKLTKRGSFTLECVVPDEQLGRFSLSANQVAPYNVFVDMAWLQEAMDLPGKANLLMAGAASDGKEISPDQLAAALKRIWSPTDVGITLRSHGTISQMESDRVFLDPSASQAALSIDNSAGVLTYMVNRIQKGERSTPYSFAVACSPSDDKALSPVPVTMRDDQVIINEWLAQSLDAAPGDTITLSYYELEAGGGFTSRERAFTVLRVDTMADFEQEAELMPKFPGLTDVEQCRDWDVGLPMEKEALNDPANQDYWESYRATPKVVVTLAAGRDMWSNRFGDTTAVRFPTAKEAVQDVLTERIDPVTVGLAPRPVREDALRAVTQAMSFGELFTAMSFFLIAAALMLTGMLFVFGIQQRAEEMGLLLGVGYRPSRVRAMYLCEGGLVALAGSIIGGLLGTGYTRMLVWGLADYWQGAVASSAIQYHAEARTIIDGIIGSFLCAMAAMTIAMWRQTKRPARELLSGDLTQGRPVSASRAACVRTRALSLAAAVAAGGAVLVARHAGHEHAVYAFFGAGFMLLLAGLGCSRLLLQRLALQPKAQLTITGLGARNASRRGGRSLTAVVLLASGCFLVFAVSAMQQDLAATAGERGSGSGGFSLLGQATIPLPDPLETDKGAALFGLEREPALTNASFVSLKVRDGDDASCFNLNRAQSPRLLGVDPQALEANGAFLPKGSEAHELWGLLDIDLPDGVIPGLAGDANTAMWNLEKKAHPTQGDEIRYRDELGNTFRVKLVGTLPMPLSIFQGTVLIAKSDFEMRYPSESGYRMFLVDLPATTNPTDATHALARRLDRMGVDVTTTLSRLLEFHGVEATYLNMFLILGGLGVVLGTLGLGIVVLRNMLERRSEFALLRCVGFSRQKILWLVLAEHWLLLVMGLVCGLTSAAVAIYPSLAAPGMHVPMQPIVLLLLGIVITGLGSTTLAVIIALRGELIPSLRRE
jgi:putative ABC transport system permease protein